MPKLNAHNLAGFLAQNYKDEMEGHARALEHAKRDNEIVLVRGYREILHGYETVIAALKDFAAREGK